MITTVASGKAAVSTTQRASAERGVGAGGRASAERALRRDIDDIDEDRSQGHHDPEHEAQHESEDSAVAAAKESGMSPGADDVQPEAGAGTRGADGSPHVVARQIAGERMDSDAISTLLSELRITSEPATEKRERGLANPEAAPGQASPRERVPERASAASGPAAPRPGDGGDGVVNRAASVYQTNQKTIGGKERFRPGMVFSERF